MVYQSYDPFTEPGHSSSINRTKPGHSRNYIDRCCLHVKMADEEYDKVVNGSMSQCGMALLQSLTTAQKRLLSKT